MIFTTIPHNLLAELAAIDSTRTDSENYDGNEDSNVALTVLNAPVYITNPADVLSLNKIKCSGAHQVVHTADSGFHIGNTADMHQAFAKLVPAIFSLSRKNPAYSDEEGNMTHIASYAVGNETTDKMGGIATMSSGWVRGTGPAVTLVINTNSI